MFCTYNKVCAIFMMFFLPFRIYIAYFYEVDELVFESPVTPLLGIQ